MRRASRFLIAGLLLTCGACAHRGGAAGEAQPAAEPVRLEVTNHNTIHMEIYVVGSGVSRRIGSVSPGMVGRFTVPQGMLGSGLLEFEARSAAPGTSTLSPPGPPPVVIRSGQFLLRPGQVVDFTVGTRQVDSRATVQEQ
jgi:hypothetical protein